MKWLKEVCIIETEDEVYYDAEFETKEVVTLFIKNLKAQCDDGEYKLMEKMSFETVESFITFLDADEDGPLLAQMMVAAAYCARYGIEINDDTELYVDEQIYYFNDCRGTHYEYSTDIDLG